MYAESTTPPRQKKGRPHSYLNGHPEPCSCLIGRSHTDYPTFDPERAAAIKKRFRRLNHLARRSVLRDLGLRRVKGNLGGTYWE